MLPYPVSFGHGLGESETGTRSTGRTFPVNERTLQHGHLERFLYENRAMSWAAEFGGGFCL